MRFPLWMAVRSVKPRLRYPSMSKARLESTGCGYACVHPQSVSNPTAPPGTPGHAHVSVHVFHRRSCGRSARGGPRVHVAALDVTEVGDELRAPVGCGDRAGRVRGGRHGNRHDVGVHVGAGRRHARRRARVDVAHVEPAGGERERPQLLVRADRSADAPDGRGGVVRVRHVDAVDLAVVEIRDEESLTVEGRRHAPDSDACRKREARPIEGRLLRGAEIRGGAASSTDCPRSRVPPPFTASPCAENQFTAAAPARMLPSGSRTSGTR